jgi:hypothetical protein
MYRPEEGKHYEVVESGTGVRVGRGFVKLLLGDHGPYVEMKDEHMRMDNLVRGSTAPFWFDSFYTRGGTKVYRQKQRVRGRNPPQSGDWFANNNRVGGYANYEPGLWYISADRVDIVEVQQRPRVGY